MSSAPAQGFPAPGFAGHRGVPSNGPAPDKSETLHGGGRRVLIAEDDADSRAVLVAFVASLGFATLEAETGARAYELMAAHADVVLVIADVNMPGMTGIELVRHGRMTPELPRVVLVTGDPRSIDAALREQALCAIKPYDFELLESVIFESLADARTDPRQRT